MNAFVRVRRRPETHEPETNVLHRHCRDASDAYDVALVRAGVCFDDVEVTD